MKTQMNPDAAVKRGYLLENFRIFHLNSIEKEAIPSHFHEFHKIILVLKGSLRYIVEGSPCELWPGQMLLVPAYSIHQPVIAPRPYERIVLWVSADSSEVEGIEDAFRLAEAERRYVLKNRECSDLIEKLSESERKKDKNSGNHYADYRYESALLTQLIILLGRCWQKESIEARVSGQSKDRDQKGKNRWNSSDPLMSEIISYVNQHLKEDLSVAALAKRCYLSESRLSKRFQEAAGCSLHQYILQKRLIQAARLIKQGKSAAYACQEAGFSDYSTFFRAFKKAFEVSPQKFQ